MLSIKCTKIRLAAEVLLEELIPSPRRHSLNAGLLLRGMWKGRDGRGKEEPTYKERDKGNGRDRKGPTSKGREKRGEGYF